MKSLLTASSFILPPSSFRGHREGPSASVCGESRDSIPEMRSKSNAACLRCARVIQWRRLPALRKEETDMPIAVGVAFKRVAKSYWFDPGMLALDDMARVVVETARGNELGTV